MRTFGDEQVNCGNSCQTRFAFPAATEAADGLTCRSPRTTAVDAGRDGQPRIAADRDDLQAGLEAIQSEGSGYLPRSPGLLAGWRGSPDSGDPR